MIDLLAQDLLDAYRFWRQEANYSAFDARRVAEFAACIGYGDAEYRRRHLRIAVYQTRRRCVDVL